tara:strand:+ start:588 stop:773 length:186 start_codon:yes stop_codon:yes gene_type:complete
MENNTSWIASAKYFALDGENQSIIVTNSAGSIFSVPIDADNRHYQGILAWVAEGNTIADAD